MKNNIITGIDIGTTKIAIIIAEIKNESINILGFGESESNGLRRGIVVDIDETSTSIEKAINIAEEQSGIEIESAYVGLTGEHIKAIECSGAITISNSDYIDPEGEKINSEHIEKVMQHAQAINMSTDRKILHTLSKEFKVDNQDNIKNPRGLSGHRLEAKVLLVTIARNIEKDLKTCLENVGIMFDGFILEPIASAYSVLNEDERNLGTALIDIGGGTSDLIIFHNNSIQHTSAIPLGGESITKDIAYGIKTSIKQAELLKCEYGLAKAALAEDQEDINVKGTNERDNVAISQKKLSKIIEARMKEIFILANTEIRRTNLSEKINFGIVLTGGGAKLKSICDLSTEVFEMDSKIGKPNSINGLNDIIENPRYATAIGLIKFAKENENVIKNFNDDNHSDEFLKPLIKKIKRFFKEKF